MPDFYGADLAFIHDSAFGALALGAAEHVCAQLHHAGYHDGTIIDLGCGGGVLARTLVDAGYSVRGIDLSEPLIERARQRAPEARFEVGACYDAEFEACVAVTAIGEVLSYSFEEPDAGDRRRALFARVHAALKPDGLLVFDIATPERAPHDGAQHVETRGEGWRVEMTVEGDRDRTILTRHITTARELKGHTRIAKETHRLRLLDADLVQAELRTAGFEVETLGGYPGIGFPRGLIGFSATRRP